MEYALIIAEQILIMFLMILLGAFCYRKQIITKEGNRQLSAVVLHVVCPVLIFMAYQTEFSKELLQGLLWAMLLSVISFVIAIAFAAVAVRKDPRRGYAIEKCSVIYSNCAFMGFPLIQALFGNTGIFYTTAYLTLFNLLVWSHGVMVMNDSVNWKGLVKAMKAPTIIAIVLGIICYVANIRLPETLAAALNYIASMNTPLAMLVAGATIAQTNLLKAFKKPRVYLVALYRLLVIPLLVLAATMFLPVSREVYMSVILATACPTATICTLFAISYNKNALYASELFAVTTILSAVTMPLMVLLVNFVI